MVIAKNLALQGEEEVSLFLAMLALFLDYWICEGNIAIFFLIVL
jgi:hypothetical protein